MAERLTNEDLQKLSDAIGEAYRKTWNSAADLISAGRDIKKDPWRDVHESKIRLGKFLDGVNLGIKAAMGDVTALKVVAEQGKISAVELGRMIGDQNRGTDSDRPADAYITGGHEVRY